MIRAFESGGLRPRGGYDAYYEGRSRVSALGSRPKPASWKSKPPGRR